MKRVPRFWIVAAIVAALLFVLVAVLRPALSPAKAQPEPPPDFSVSYKTTRPSAEAGDVLTYTIVVSNAGGAATGVVLSDTLPPGLAFAACRYDVAGSAAAAVDGGRRRRGARHDHARGDGDGADGALAAAQLRRVAVGVGVWVGTMPGIPTSRR
jgi:uncharacterized repeat protein (TIGR01451 family)